MKEDIQQIKELFCRYTCNAKMKLEPHIHRLCAKCRVIGCESNCDNLEEVRDVCCNCQYDAIIRDLKDRNLLNI